MHAKNKITDDAPVDKLFKIPYAVENELKTVHALIHESSLKSTNTSTLTLSEEFLNSYLLGWFRFFFFFRNLGDCLILPFFHEEMLCQVQFPDVINITTMAFSTIPCEWKVRKGWKQTLNQSVIVNPNSILIGMMLITATLFAKNIPMLDLSCLVSCLLWSSNYVMISTAFFPAAFKYIL